MSRCMAFAIAVLCAAAIASCDRSPTRPTPPPAPPAPPSPPQGPTLQSIRIDGPTTVAPGGTAQFTATGQLSDGTTRDQTATVTWRSSDSAVLSISSTGAATAGKAGQVVIAAESESKRAGVEVLVLPPGTFRLTGAVSEAGVPVVDATVDLLDGSRAKLSTQTDSDGIYRLFGVVGNIEVRVMKAGYLEQVKRLFVSDDAKADFALASERTDLAGTYQLTVSAASRCPSTGWALPQAARVRTYTATITQDGPRLSLVLGGAALVDGSFTGRVEPGVVTFDVRGLDSHIAYYYYFASSIDFLEVFSPTSLLIVSGRVTATPTSSGISGTLNGVIGIVPAPISPLSNLSAGCKDQHEFVLTRK